MVENCAWLLVMIGLSLDPFFLLSRTIQIVLFSNKNFNLYGFLEFSVSSKTYARPLKSQNNTPDTPSHVMRNVSVAVRYIIQVF